MSRPRFLYITISLLLAILASTTLIASLYLLQPINLAANNNYLLEIKRGDSLYTVTNNLAQQRIISFPRLFRVIVYFLGQDSNIRTGEYELTSNLRVYELISKLTAGEVKQYNLAIIEGSSFVELINKIINTPAINSTLDAKILVDSLQQAKLDQNVISSLKQTSATADTAVINLNEIISAEGLFYPDTYFYTKGDLVQDLFNRAFLKLNTKLKSEWDNRADKKDTIIKTPYQALVLASILEKEASDSNERKLVSGVLYNRLRLNMPLQVDPTVIYSLGKEYKGNISKKDMLVPSKFNTYINKGLPPAPISSVSLDSLRAALHPAEHDLLYFVAMGNGKHFFSATLDKHNEAVQKYQKSKIKSGETKGTQ